MQELLHALGICPDSYQHVSIVKAILLNSNELQYIYQYIKHLIK